MAFFSSWEKTLSLFGLLWDGLGVTLSLFALTLLFSLPLGLLVAFGRMSRLGVVRGPVSLYILIMRGTPLILQIFTIYFILPQVFGHAFDRMTAVVISFALNYAAYFAEIYRGGILSIPVGQYEAGKVLGMTGPQTFFRIVLPQVLKRIVLPVSNEVITLIKDTALVTAIGMVELYRIARNIASSSGSLEPLFAAGIFYLALNGLVTLFFNALSQKLDYYKG